MNANTRKVAVVIGATSKWQSDGRNTRLVHGGALDDSGLPVGVRWGVGGAVAQKFAAEGYLTVLTTRRAANAAALKAALDGATGKRDMIGLDTGCVWGRHLTAYCLEDGSITRVGCTELAA